MPTAQKPTSSSLSPLSSTTERTPIVRPLGDRAAMLLFQAADEETCAAWVSGYCRALETSTLPAVLDIVPAFNRVCVHYDPLILLREGIDPLQWIQTLAALPYQPLLPASAREQVIPVCYELALDLSELASNLDLSSDVIVQQHVNAAYRVVMVGFAPGFPYMSGLPDALQRSRRSTPRTEVPAGSVAIAEDLCGIYPRALPGGWHIIGRTPLTLFDIQRPTPCLLQAGDIVRFQAISRARFEAWSC